MPDFDTSDEMKEALLRLKNENPSLLKKLLSQKSEYVELRQELFPKRYNLRAL